MRYVFRFLTISVFALAGLVMLNGCAPAQTSQVVFEYQSSENYNGLSVDHTLPTDRCYVLHVIGSDFSTMFPANLDPDAPVCDANVKASGLGKWYGLYNSGATASIEVLKGKNRYFHLLGIAKGTTGPTGAEIPDDCSGEFQVVMGSTINDDPSFQYRAIGSTVWQPIDSEGILEIYATGKADIGDGTNTVVMNPVESLDGLYFGREYDSCGSDHDIREVRTLSHGQRNDTFANGNIPDPDQTVTLHWNNPQYDTSDQTFTKVFFSVQPYSSETSAPSTPEYCVDTATNVSLPVVPSDTSPSGFDDFLFNQTTQLPPQPLAGNNGYEVRICSQFQKLEDGSLHRSKGAIYRFKTYPTCDFVGRTSEMSPSGSIISATSFASYFSSHVTDLGTDTDSYKTFCLTNDANAQIQSQASGTLSVLFSDKVVLIGDPINIPTFDMISNNDVAIRVNSSASGGSFAAANLSFMGGSAANSKAIYISQSSSTAAEVPYLHRIDFPGSDAIPNPMVHVIVEGNVRFGRLDNIFMQLTGELSKGVIFQPLSSYSPSVDMIRSLTGYLDVTSAADPNNKESTIILLDGNTSVGVMRNLYLNRQGTAGYFGSAIHMKGSSSIGLIDDGYIRLDSLGYGIYMDAANPAIPVRIGKLLNFRGESQVDDSPVIWNRYGRLQSIIDSSFSTGASNSHSIVLDESSTLEGMSESRFEHSSVTGDSIALFVQNNGPTSGVFKGNYSRNSLCTMDNTETFNWTAGLGEGDWLTNGSWNTTTYNLITAPGVGAKTLTAIAPLSSVFGRQFGGYCDH